MGSDTSDTSSDRPNEPSTDSDAEGTGERPTVGTERAPKPEIGADRVARDRDVGLGAGLDQAEEARRGITDEELLKKEKLKKRKR